MKAEGQGIDPCSVLIEEEDGFTVAIEREPRMESGRVGGVVRVHRNLVVADIHARLDGAHVATLILLAFYMTLDRLFAVAFLVYGVPVAWLATVIGAEPMSTSGVVAAVTFFGGYAAQFVIRGLCNAAECVRRGDPISGIYLVDFNWFGI